MVELLLSPDHLVDNSGVALDELHYLCADIFIGVGRHRNAVVSVSYHLHRYIYRLQEVVPVDAGKDEAAFVEGLGALGGSADADGRKWVTYACEE